MSDSLEKTVFETTSSSNRKRLVMFYLIDVSGSMRGEKIATVNDIMVNLLPEMQEISNKNPRAVLKLAAMKFSDDAEWITDIPMNFGDFEWNNLREAGLTALGAACRLLNEKLSSTKGFLKDDVGSFAPVIVLLSDGGPTDDFNGGLKVLKNNDWFKQSTKIAIGIGDNYNKSVLTDFTGNSELVIDVVDIGRLKNIIRTVSVTASKIASQNKDGSDKTEELIEVIQDLKDAEEDSLGNVIF